MTAAISETVCRRHLQQPGVSPSVVTNPFGLKAVAFELPDTSDGGGTATITIANYDISLVYDVSVFEHGTTDDVISEVTRTTAVSGGVLTVTFPSSEINKKRVIVVWGT